MNEIFDRFFINNKQQKSITGGNQARNRKLLTFLLAICLFGSGWFGHAWLNTNTVSQPLDKKFTQLMDIMTNQWYYAAQDENIRNSLMDRAMRGMVTTDFDPHTVYWSKEEAAEFEQAVDQKYSGIGVKMDLSSGYPLIESVFKDSPAQQGGLLPGDFIIAVDGQSVANMEYEQLRELVLGETGTQVVITFKRNEQESKVTLTRADIAYTVDLTMRDGIAQIAISTFGSSTPDELQAVLDELKAQQVNKLIIDLRDNGGGYLEALMQMSSFFLDQDQVVFKQEYVDGEIKELKAYGGKYTNFSDIIILINQHSASASEVFASSLQEHGVAKLVGVTSYGKGTSQNVYPFSDGSALKYTQTHWYTPNDHQINGQGIKPDYEVAMPSFIELETPTVNEQTLIKVDSVSEVVLYVQQGLSMMGYEVDRVDGYYSVQTQQMMEKLAKDYEFSVPTQIDQAFYQRFLASAKKYYRNNVMTVDTQLAKAVSLLK
jgi:carboxyl-terminal processing protease